MPSSIPARVRHPRFGHVNAPMLRVLEDHQRVDDRLRGGDHQHEGSPRTAVRARVLKDHQRDGDRVSIREAVGVAEHPATTRPGLDLARIRGLVRQGALWSAGATQADPEQLSLEETT